MVIRVLEAEVVNQIAAGEVIERPFSVLKELMENSLDAGARRVEVELGEGGRSLIRVRDDGRGMGPGDLGLAFRNHATSKLATLEDLQAIASLGFRGEALASIGSVSRARILSRPPGSEEGFEIRAEGGRLGEVRPAPSPPGTLVEVRDLFFNLPARRRFLKTPRGERGRCLEAFTRLCLAHPDRGFLLAGKRETLLSPGEELRVRVGKLFGGELQARCLEVGYERSGIGVRGLVVDPDGARKDRTQEHLFLNGRPIRDRRLSHAVFDAFQPYLIGGRFPVTFLFLHMDPARVDVNVHPTKAEVRFHEERLVYAVVRSAVQEALAGRRERIGERTSLSLGGGAPATGLPRLPEGLFGKGEGIGSGFGKLPPRKTAAGGGGEALPPSPPRFLVVRDLYILFETEEGFTVVDPHALHERVIYERLLRAWRAGEVPVQRLLVPEVLDLPPADKELLLSFEDSLAEAGLILSDFGGSSVNVEGYPSALRRVDAGALVEGLLRDLREGDPPREPEEVRERFHSAACRSAVMSGDRLSEEEVRSLLAEAERLEHPDNCPHGRPTMLSFSMAQLARHFRRSGPRGS